MLYLFIIAQTQITTDPPIVQWVNRNPRFALIIAFGVAIAAYKAYQAWSNRER